PIHQVAGGPVVLLHLYEGRDLRSASQMCIWTACVEIAAWRRRHRTRNLSADNFSQPFGRRVWHRHSCYEGSGIRVQGVCHYCLCVTQFNDPPEIHDSKDRKSTRLNSSHVAISYAVFCLKKKNKFSFLKR